MKATCQACDHPLRKIRMSRTCAVSGPIVLITLLLPNARANQNSWKQQPGKSRKTNHAKFVLDDIDPRQESSIRATLANFHQGSADL
jgi:hypothetical protein